MATPLPSETPDAALQRDYYDTVEHYLGGSFDITYLACVKDRSGAWSKSQLRWRKQGTDRARLDGSEEIVNGTDFPVTYLITEQQKMLCSDQLGAYFKAVFAPVGNRPPYSPSEIQQYTSLGMACIEAWDPEYQLDQQFYSQFSVPRANSIAEFEQVAPKVYEPGKLVRQSGAIANEDANCFLFLYDRQSCYARSGALLYSDASDGSFIEALSVQDAPADSAFAPPNSLKPVGPTPVGTKACHLGFYQSPDYNLCNPTPTARETHLHGALLSPEDLSGTWKIAQLNFEPLAGLVFDSSKRYDGRVAVILENEDSSVQVLEDIIDVSPGTGHSQFAAFEDTAGTYSNQWSILVGDRLGVPVSLAMGDEAFGYQWVHQKLGVQLYNVVIRRGDSIIQLSEIARTAEALDLKLFGDAYGDALSKLDALPPQP